MPDYKEYLFTPKERKLYYIRSGCALACLGILFYKSIVFAFLCTILSKPLEVEYVKYKIKKRQEVLLEGFRDMLYSVSGSIAAGRQMPIAIADAKMQAENSYGEGAYITKELSLMVRAYEEAHGTVEDLLSDFGVRSGIAEIKQFALVYRICKHSGGDLEGVTLTCANLLLDRISFRGEVNMLTAQRKVDILFLVSMPMLILLFLNIASPAYISVLYCCLAGRAIMTACLL